MTTTKAMAKLYKAIVGSEGRNSAAKILSDLADNWSAQPAAMIPALPSSGSTATYVLKATLSDGTYTYSWVAES